MADEEKKDAKKAPAKKAAAKAEKKPAKKAAAKKEPAKKAEPKKADSKKAEAKKPTAKKETAKKETSKEDGAKAEAKAKAPAKKAAAKKEPAAPVVPPVVRASARYVRIAPRKARLVADQVRGMHLDDALPLLRFSTRSAAQDIRKLIESAAANAEANHDLVADDLMIKDIHVDEGPTLRRYRPRALGRATRINKRTSHIAVALTPEE